ncbi:MAG: hypothetical protein PHW32_00955 [Bacilli bacterium]|nr:hypothetical protein [Bacilli bacterium]MDD4283237.1 hypothetical protein [Bacilli bacterium]MDD4718673.1 hypothetical protein [Bacilli bacterium]
MNIKQMPQKYNELRQELFDLRLKQKFQKSLDNETEFLKMENEITKIKNEMKSIIQQSIEIENKIGGRKK